MELEQQVVDLKRQLALSEQALAKAKEKIVQGGQAVSDKISIGPATIGGPSRGDKGGNVELDTFRLNLSLEYQQLIGKLAYRWYDSYSFMHTSLTGLCF